MCAECERLRAENAELRSALGTEQSMHLAWRKRAEEAERGGLPVPTLPVTSGALADYEQAMAEAVPQITSDLQRRAALAEEARLRPMGPPVR